MTERADVVFPVAPPAEKTGTFMNWEGRERPFAEVLKVPAAMPDVRALAALAQEMDSVARVQHSGRGEAGVRRARPLGRRPGERADVHRPVPALGAFDSTRLATWRMLIDDSRGNDGEPHLVADRPPARWRGSR